MLYELVSVVRVSNPLAANAEAKELATTIGRLIIQNRGVVRKLYLWVTSCYLRL